MIMVFIIAHELILTSSGLAQQILLAIPTTEINWFDRHVYLSIDKIYEYRNSIYGILDAVKNDYSDLDLDVEKLSKELSSNENIDFLKAVVDKMV